MTKILSSIKLPVATQAIESIFSGAGLVYYDSANQAMRLHDGTSWDYLVGSMDMPIGSVQPWLGSATPSGWLVCTGQAVSRSTYAGLFSIISTRFGTGDGSTTFNVPDLQGFQIIGASASLGSVDNTSAFRQGTNSSETIAVHSPSAASHSHTLSYTAFTETQHDGSHSHSATASDGTVTFTTHTYSDTSNGGQSHTHTSSVASGAGTSGVITGTTRATAAHTHGAPTVSTDTHTHSVTTSSWSAHSAHSHSPVFSLSSSGNTSSASPSTHNHTPSPSSDGHHAHDAHSYETYMVHYIIKAA